MSPETILVIAIVLLVVLSAAFLIYWRIQKQKHDLIRIRKRYKRDYLFYVTRVLRKMPGIRKYYSKFQNRLSMLYPSDEHDISHMATVMMLQSMIVAVLATIVLSLLSSGDVFFILLSVFIVYIIFTSQINGKLSKLEIKILEQFADFITTCRGNYHTVGMVDEAIYMCLEDLPHEVYLHISKIYEIITDVHIEDRVEEYTDIAPNRFLKIFTSVCATIQEYGDKRLENGESLFLKNLEYIKEEVYIELNKIRNNEYRFSSFTAIAISPVFFLKVIEKWVMSIQDLSSFYKGPAGFASMIGIFIVAFICYELILTLKEGRNRQEHEHKMLEQIAKIGVINMFLTKIINRWYSKALRISNSLRMAGNHISAQAYLLQRILLGLTLASFALIMTIAATFISRYDIIHNFTTVFTESVIPDEEYRKAMQEAGEYYTKVHRNIEYEGTEEEIEELTTEINENTTLRYDLAEEVAKVVIERGQKYRNTFYMWYNILIVVAAFLFGYFIPLAYLKYQMTIMRWSMEDEVSQFRSIALILMNVDGMTLDVILEWMERFAFCFKDSISDCIMNLEHSASDAIQKMRNSESFPPFLRFCDNLLNIDDVGVAAAFDEVVTEQENYKEQRKLNNEMVVTRRSNLGQIIAFVPTGACLVGYLIWPITLMAYQMYTTMNTNLNF